MKIDIQWFGVTSVESLAWHDTQLLKYFNVRPHRGLMTEFDVGTQHQVVPHSLTPTDGLHRVLSRTVYGGAHELGRLPYLVENHLDGHTLQIVSIRGELFPGNVLVLTVKGRIEFPEFGGWFDKIYPSLRELRTPRSSHVIDSLIRQFIAVAIGGRDFPAEQVSFRDYFVLQVNSHPFFGAQPSESFYRDFVALLTDAVRPLDLGKVVVDSVAEENRTLNEKAEAEMLLINRQGGVYFLPNGPYESPNRHRFKKVSGLATIALFTRQFLSNSSSFRDRHPGMATFVAERLRRFIDLPELVFETSFANHHTWQRLSESLKLQLQLEDWDSRSTQAEATVASQATIAPARWWEIRDFERDMDTDR
ncbi:hypothetical protein [Mycolicibacterium setense]|uniref:hypothetical protein n=1 Tax=Mycolicibacterium setense TaxID=431269 RepID=UPI0005751979|nr:hypothetical protein [Mycolicibacterium setense]KHO18091.1 hypothetical protein QQ25_28785 [Mycolicibacterium setense]MCV7112031.1 hypothetical protein [Mycolicibacterium setense]